MNGAHNVKLGADLYRYQLNSWADASTFGAYTFNNWNDFAAGNPVSYSQYFGGDDARLPGDKPGVLRAGRLARDARI